jgi:hypothetical protein
VIAGTEWQVSLVRGSTCTYQVTAPQKIRGGPRWYTAWRRSDWTWAIRSEHRHGFVNPAGKLGREIVALVEAFEKVKPR